MPLVYPPLVYLLARCVWVGVRGRPIARSCQLWRPAVLFAAAVFLIGFRVGLNVEDSNVIDVGYAGVIGAQRISSGVMPYDNFPKEDELKACGPAESSGEIRDRIRVSGRCGVCEPLGDTYLGPVAYEAYLPGYLILGWTGKWDDLPAAHLSSILFDLLCLLGLALVGLRFGGTRLGATLAFAWAAYPFTQYVSNSNTNDAIMPVFLIFGFWLASSRTGARGISVALSGWTEIRVADRGAALAHLPRTGPAAPSSACLRRGIPGRHPRCLLRSSCSMPPDPGGTDVLRAHAEDANHT